MDGVVVALIVFLLIGVPWISVIVYRIFFAPDMDRDRIRDYFRHHYPDVTVSDIEWQLFGPGWMDKNRIYLVYYRYRKSTITHTVYVKTTLFSGVYVCQDDY